MCLQFLAIRDYVLCYGLVNLPFIILCKICIAEYCVKF
jgi:hypothetical protein